MLDAPIFVRLADLAALLHDQGISITPMFNNEKAYQSYKELLILLKVIQGLFHGIGCAVVPSHHFLKAMSGVFSELTHKVQ